MYACNSVSQLLFISDAEKHPALNLALVCGSGCFLSCLHEVRQTILKDLTNWTEQTKKHSRDQTYLYDIMFDNEGNNIVEFACGD